MGLLISEINASLFRWNFLLSAFHHVAARRGNRSDEKLKDLHICSDFRVFLFTRRVLHHTHTEERGDEDKSFYERI